MKVIVCVKQVPDMTEARMDKEKKTIIREGVPSIINPYDIHAVEEALKIKDKKGGSVIALSMGIPSVAWMLRQLIAMGVDSGILLTDKAFAGSDTLATSYILSKAIRKIGDFDIIICGKQTIDGDTAQVGPGLAEKLGIPHITNVVEIKEAEKDYIVCKRAVEKGWEVVKSPVPVLITVEKNINIPRFPNIVGIMNMKNAKIETWNAGNINVDYRYAGLKGSPTKVIKTFIPETKVAAEVITGTVDYQVEKMMAIFDKLHINIKNESNSHINESGQINEANHISGTNHIRERNSVKADRHVNIPAFKNGVSVLNDVFASSSALSDVSELGDICALNGDFSTSNNTFKGLDNTFEFFPNYEVIRDNEIVKDKHEGIWVFTEIDGRTVAKVSLELISKAGELASKLNTEVSAVLLGYDVENIAQTLLSYGADNVYLVDHPSLHDFNDEIYSKIMIELATRYKPDIFLLGATVRGRSLAPRIASALNTGLTADCTQLDIDSEKRILLQTRPAFGGDLMATIICPECRPQMATVRPGVFEVNQPCIFEHGVFGIGRDIGQAEDKANKEQSENKMSKSQGENKVSKDQAGSKINEDQAQAGGETAIPETTRPKITKTIKHKIIKPKIAILPGKIEILEYIEDTTESFNITEAEVIVAAGRGMGKKENLKLVEELASLIGGEVGASRAIVEAGWIDRSHQVGQSGNTVSPKLYIVCGISGAVQHMVGLKSPGVIIAINKDVNAPIMKAANYAFVGDAIEILAALIKALKQ